VSKSRWVIGILESHKVILKEALTVEIEKERKSLVETAFKEGFTSSNTVEISQFIDEMLNELEKIK
jgi:stage 0 sporulation regulatory protein